MEGRGVSQSLNSREATLRVGMENDGGAHNTAEARPLTWHSYRNAGIPLRMCCDPDRDTNTSYEHVTWLLIPGESLPSK